MHQSIADRYQIVCDRIQQAAQAAGRSPDQVALIAVSKYHTTAAVQGLIDLGHRHFGESYLQEAVAKIEYIGVVEGLEWHFVGPIQSNKTRDISRYFHWVHSVDRLKVAQRLDSQRSRDLPPINVCIQVNVTGEETKSGVRLDALEPLADAIAEMPRLVLRGLMTIPRRVPDLVQQRQAFSKLRVARDELNERLGLTMDTLSMGMSDDLEAAILEGSTMVRVGTDLFGLRR